MPIKENAPDSSNKNVAPEEDNKYDFSNLTFEELFRVPVVEMSFKGEPLTGPDFFQLDFLALQRIPVFLSPDNKDESKDVGNTDDVNDDSYDFLALSFEDLLKVPVRLNRWQDGDDVQEPDLDSLSLADLMKLPVRRAFISDLDPETLNGLLGDSAFSDLPSNDGGSSGNSGNPLLYISYGNNDKVTDTSPPIDNGDNNNSGGSSGGGGFTPPPPDGIPVAVSDSGFFAIKGFGFAPFSQNTGNLLANDDPGLDNPITVNDFVLNNGSIPGTIQVNPNGSFTYLPPGINNNNPGSPTDYAFSYRVVDFNGTLSNYASVSLKLYDPPVLSINDVQIVEGPGVKIALFTVVLTGAIPIPLTITYATHDGNVANHTAVAGQDYQSTSGSYTFSNINPAVITQSFTISVTILDDNIAELVQKFFVNLNIAGTFVNAGASDLTGIGAISDPDILPVTNVNGGNVYESGLIDGSDPNASNTILSGNLLTGQNFGQIPNPSGVDVSALNHPDANGPAIYDSGDKTWTLTGDYFTLVVYREDVISHSKGDYVYTLTDNIAHTNNQDFFDSLQLDLTPIDPESTIVQNTRADTGDLNVIIVDDLVTAQDDTGTFYAIKGSNAGNSSGNLFANDTASADRPLTIVSFNYIDENGDPQTALVPNNNSTSVTPYYGGTLTMHSDGTYDYVPPAENNPETPGEPSVIEFSYKAQDTDGSYDNADVNIKLYNQPKLTIDNVQIIEGDDAVALFTVTLTGAIPSALTIHYSTQDGSAIAGEDYEAILNGSHTFSDLDSTHTTQSFTISVNILNDNIAELVQHFSLILDISGTYINTTTSVVTGDGAISDPDAIHVDNVDAGTVHESGLADGSDAGNQSVTLSGNLLAGQDFGQIPLSNIDISDVSHVDQTSTVETPTTWTIIGDYFNLVVYREDVVGHNKGDYIYTLINNVDNINGHDFLQGLHFDVTPIDPESLVDQNTRTDTGDLNVDIQDDAPHANDDIDTFYAIKGGNDTQSSGNLLANDIPGADNPIKIVSITYANESNMSVTESVPDIGALEVTPYHGGTLSISADGSFSYIPPDADDSGSPDAPDTIPFSYLIQDADGSQSTANVDIKLYDAPKLDISDVEIVEGDNVTAVFTVTLTGAIPSDLTIHYSTQDGSALAGQDYVGLSNIAHIFSASDLSLQSFQISVDIINDNIAELLENFSVVLDTTGTNINLAISDITGNGAISDPDALHIADVPAGTIDEADLPDGSSPNPPPVTLTGNLLAGQDFGQIPLSNVVLSNIGHPDGVTTTTSATATVVGSYFNLTVYLDDSTVGHVKGDYVYTLTNDVDNVSGADFIQNIHFDVTPDDPDSSINQSTRTDTGDLIVHIKDDSPSITVSAVAPADDLVVDESNLTLNASANFADNFNASSSFGADGAGVVSPVAYTLSTLGGASGLTDMATNESVVLSMNGAVVEGRTSTTGLLVFTVSVNSSGTVTLDQIRALKHFVTNNPDDATTLSAGDLIKLTATGVITDNDGSSSTHFASIDIATTLSFKDDGSSFININDPNTNNIVQISVNNPTEVNAVSPDVTHTVQLANWNYGADGAGSISLDSFSGSGNISVLSSSSSQLVLQVQEGANVVGVITLNQTGNDTIALYNRPNTGTSSSDVLLTSEGTTVSGSGIYYVDSGLAANQTVKITADDGDGDFNPSTDSHDIVTINSNRWSVDGNIINKNESLKFESINKVTLAAIPVSDFSFKTVGFTSGDSSFNIRIRVKYADLTTEDFTKTVTEGLLINVASLVGFNTGSLINSVEIKSLGNAGNQSNAGFRIDEATIYNQTSTPPADLDYNFVLKILDNDGDATLQSFTLHIDGTQPLSSPGYTVDGPIAGASVFQDINDDFIQNSNETSTISDQLGAYNIILVDTNLDDVIDSHDGRLVSFGGLDTQTNLQYNIPMFAPLGSSIISPLTSILVMQLGGNLDPNFITQKLAENLGLLQGDDLAQSNPITTIYSQENHASLYQAAAVMTLSVQLSEAFGEILGVSPASIADEIYRSIGNQVLDLPKNTVADFTNSAFLQLIINDVSVQTGVNPNKLDSILNLLTESQITIHNVNDNLTIQDYITAISKIQQDTQGDYAQVIKQFYSDSLSEAELGYMVESLHQYNQAVMTANNHDLYALQATDDTVYVSEHALSTTYSDNILKNDTSGSVPTNTVSVRSIEFTVDNLLSNHPELYQSYIAQGASIIPDGSHYIVKFDLPADNTLIPITMYDGSILKIQADGHYDFYQSQGRLNQDAHYEWTYTITAPLSEAKNVGDDKGVLSLSISDDLVHANNDQFGDTDTNISANSTVSLNILAKDSDTFTHGNSNLKVTQVSYFNPSLNATVYYELSDSHPQESFMTARGAHVTINTDGTFIYQAGAGFTSPNEISEVFNYKIVNDCNISSNGQISATTYNNNYTLVNLPGTSGDDILNNNGVYNQGTVVMSGAGGNNTFTIDMGMSGLKANLIVIQDFDAGNNTLKFINVQDGNHDTIMQQSEIIAQITNIHSDSPYAGGNISFQLQNGTTVIMQNLSASDPLAAPPSTAAALISLIDEHGNIVGSSS